MNSWILEVVNRMMKPVQATSIHKAALDLLELLDARVQSD